ncbi:MAG: hypothetical protein HC848_02080 [Limnobacter sp.]|nr:hypothetical protein [Limnobacter sp.]
MNVKVDEHWKFGRSKPTTTQASETGFISGYLLYGIALLSVVGLAYAKIYDSYSQAELVDRTVNTLETQVQTLMVRVIRCVSQYPDGTHGEFAQRPAFPAPPVATYANNRTVMSNVECPGIPSGSKLLTVFGYLPQAPAGFNEWEYQHTSADGVRLILSPSVANGEAVVRTRLKNRLGLGYEVIESGDELIITLEK